MLHKRQKTFSCVWISVLFTFFFLVLFVEEQREIDCGQKTRNPHKQMVRFQENARSTIVRWNQLSDRGDGSKWQTEQLTNAPPDDDSDRVDDAHCIMRSIFNISIGDSDRLSELYRRWPNKKERYKCRRETCCTHVTTNTIAVVRNEEKCDKHTRTPHNFPVCCGRCVCWAKRDDETFGPPPI